jgi:hypothetical protein
VSRGEIKVMRQITLVCAFVLVALPAFCEDPSCDEIIARYAAARGGDARLAAVRTIIYRGTYKEGDVSFPAALSLMRPYYKLVGDPEKLDTTFAEGYDGSTWELYGDPGLVVRTVGAASAAGRHATSVDGPLIGYRERGWAVVSKGRTPIGDRAAYRLTVHMPDGFEMDEFIDSESWLLIAERKSAPVHAFGQKVLSEERISDYRAVAGVLFPFVHREVEITTGRILNEVTWTSIVVNREIDVSRFSPPVLERTVLRAFLDHLFLERSDPDALLWSYDDFRRSHEDVDTHYGIEFVGYQILKMGDSQSALALLERNAADYPRSASGAYGLGRAYKATGRSADARREFQRALTVDGSYRRAKEALDQMAAEKSVPIK